MKDNNFIVLVLVFGMILLVLWSTKCEKYSSHAFPGPDGHSRTWIAVGRGIYHWDHVSGYENCVKSLIEQEHLLFKEADQRCTYLLSDPSTEEYPI
uniref:Uncharacterized protein n=1 Tax=Marseillevirus LCMAC101 TaxID=2506602 RepID=A0A481YQV2_9VIRU|nr:MAG: hypothetical protein LCMAC101_00360 [Marseillevirus LCMAC101]